MDPLPDEDLFARLLQGDEEALETLFARYAQPLYGFLWRLTGDQALAEDLLQEVFIRLVNYAGKLPQNFRAWFYTVARNLAYDAMRARRRQQSHRADGFDGSVEDLMDAAQKSPETAVQSRDDDERVRQSLERLPDEQREVVLLRFYQGLSLEEIATVVEVSLGTVKSRLYRALKLLRGMLLREEMKDER
jgi:RNA polymerase sigma-70 factor (ECF subfamily)